MHLNREGLEPSTPTKHALWGTKYQERRILNTTRPHLVCLGTTPTLPGFSMPGLRRPGHQHRNHHHPSQKRRLPEKQSKMTPSLLLQAPNPRSPLALWQWIHLPPRWRCSSCRAHFTSGASARAEMLIIIHSHWTPRRSKPSPGIRKIPISINVFPKHFPETVSRKQPLSPPRSIQALPPSAQSATTEIT